MTEPSIRLSDGVAWRRFEGDWQRFLPADEWYDVHTCGPVPHTVEDCDKLRGLLAAERPAPTLSDARKAVAELECLATEPWAWDQIKKLKTYLEGI